MGIGVRGVFHKKRKILSLHFRWTQDSVGMFMFQVLRESRSEKGIRRESGTAPQR